MGGLGHLAVQYAFHRKLKVIAVDVSEAELEQARGLGASFTVAAAGAGARHSKGMRRRRCSPAADAVARSRRGGRRAAPQRTGVLVLAGLAQGALPLPGGGNAPSCAASPVRGSYLGTRADLEEVFRLAETGVGPPARGGARTVRYTTLNGTPGAR